MVYVNDCCCGCSLRVGSYIILSLFMVYGGLLTYFTVIDTTSTNPFFSVSSPVLYILGGNNCISQTLTVIQLISTAIALYGVGEKKSSYMYPFTLISVTKIGYSFIIFCGYILMLSDLLKDDNVVVGRTVKVNLHPLVTIMVVLVVLAYFIVVVDSYRKQLVNEAKAIRDTESETPSAAAWLAAAAIVNHNLAAGRDPYNVHPPSYEYKSQQLDFV